MPSLSFYLKHLLFSGKIPDAELLIASFRKTEDEAFTCDDKKYLVNSDNINDQYIWISARFGRAKPYSPTVFNIETHKEESNPRSEKQVEPSSQVFCLYSIEDMTFPL